MYMHRNISLSSRRASEIMTKLGSNKIVKIPVFFLQRTSFTARSTYWQKDPISNKLLLRTRVFQRQNESRALQARDKRSVFKAFGVFFLIGSYLSHFHAISV